MNGETMSDPLEKQWERYQNEHCSHCASADEFQGDYINHLACMTCRTACYEETMSDPLEKQWERYQNEHCSHCASADEFQGDYINHLACMTCRTACYEEAMAKREAVRD